MTYIPNNPNGQATMANSAPVVIASDQSLIPIADGITNFVFSANGINSTTANLTAGSTFTGSIEQITTYQDLSFLAYSDQNLTITINQFIDVAGAKLIEQRIFSYSALDKLAESFPINGNYVQVIITNNGGSSTTILDVNTAYGVITTTNELKDDYLRGAAAQTATVNNILTPVSGVSSVEAIKYRSFTCQVVSTGTAGTFIFEGSNDNVNFQSIPVYNQALIVRVPIVTAITATSSQIIYEASCNFRWVRLRIATTITGGSIQAHTIFLHNGLNTTSQVVSNGTAANFLATVSGTVTANGNAGTAAHSAAVSGNPVYTAGKVVPTTIATVDATLVAGDAGGTPVTTGQQVITKDFGTAELDYTFLVNPSVTTTTIQPLVLASGTANVRNYIASLIMQTDTIGAAGSMFIVDGQGAIGTSVTIATPGVFTSTAHDLKIGDCIVFTSIGTITGISVNTQYWVTATSFAATTFTLAATHGGAALQITGSTSAFTFYRVLQLVRIPTAAISTPVQINYATPVRSIANGAINVLIPTSLTSGAIYLTVDGYRGF